MKKGTICFLVKERKVLLARIQYSERIERWNGVGGVVDENETLEEAAIREVKEELGVKVRAGELVLKHEFASQEYYLYVYVVFSWQGEPKNLESSLKELRWFSFEEVPYERMWPGNIGWLPKILKG